MNDLQKKDTKIYKYYCFVPRTLFKVEKMQLNRHKILEIILLKEYKYNKRCLPVESSYEAIWFVYMSMYIYGTNIDRMPGSAPLDGVSFLCC